ncbi:hypothetical protein F4803DRAFT_328560 [Xylaria telfairii]|nr:hypothetical protein F4803DRAFT_328560 [Xylaria telfairii]
MRLNVALSGLLACSIGISTAIPPPNSNSVIQIQYEETTPTTPLVIDRSVHSSFKYASDGETTISMVKLKLYDSAGPENDQIIANVTIPTSVSISGSGRNVMLSLNERGTDSGLLPKLFAFENDTITIVWDYDHNPVHDYLDKPLYLECKWTTSSRSGNSTSQLFAFYESNPAIANQALWDTNNTAGPARQETSVPTSTSSEVPMPPASGTASPTTSGTTSQPSSGTISQSAGAAGLNRNGVIGVAVGVTVGGLLVAGTLVWWFCFRRRRRTTAHHAMPSYASDVDVHAMMQDKEIPVALESSSPRSAYGSGGDEGRPSADHYVPYSDRSVTSPTPDHRRMASNPPAPAPAPAAAAGAVGAASQTDPSRTRGAGTPTPAITSHYAHLVEEGMTDDEIRRLEEEERQLDAAIEDAGRRGSSGERQRA